jgi:hypothetical protein
MKAKEDLGVGCFDDVPLVRGSSDSRKCFKGSSTRVSAGLNLEDVRGSTTSPGHLIVVACKHTLRRVDGQLREGSGDRGEDDEESHFWNK